MKQKIHNFLFVFAAAASFLFFSVQLAASKAITPIFGGTAWVWVLTLLFFQAALLTGYFIAGMIINKKTKFVLAFLGIFIMLSSLNIMPAERWGAYVYSYGLFDVLYILAMAIGLPGLALSSATIILQRSAYNHDISPWQLYFYSNAGSILALLIYPTLVENMLTLSVFMVFWRIMLFMLGLLITLVSLYISSERQFKLSEQENPENITRLQVAKWLFFSAIPSASLAIVSVVLTQDIAAAPFLWALPLAIFLIAFSLPFAPKPILAQSLSFLAMFFFMGIILYVLLGYISINHIYLFILLLALLFLVTWISVTGLVENKPSPRKLQYFYTCIAIGGLIGTLLVSVFSPLVFNDFIERLVIIPLLFLLPYIVGKGSRKFNLLYLTRMVFIPLIIAGLASSAIIYAIKDGGSQTVLADTVHSSRSMYGTIKVIDNYNEAEGTKTRILRHGNTIHGSQRIIDGKLDNSVPTTYYTYASPLRKLYDKIQTLHEKPHVAVVGLGVGTMNYYSSPNIYTTYFEIDENMVKVAKKHFAFLDINSGNYAIEIGDGRRLLEEKQDNIYSLLILDAFSSNSIPAHLLTSEAVDLYFNKLKDDGILLVHASNRYVNIHYIVDVVLKSKGYNSYIYESPYSTGASSSTWVIGSKIDLEDFSSLSAVRKANVEHLIDRVWTDDYTPLIPYLR